LHGFLGSREDWDPVLQFLPKECKAEAIDLPGHGTTPFCEKILTTVKEQSDALGVKNLIVYSAGGRLALCLKAAFPHHFGKVIVISGHPGLATAFERERKWEEDQKWIERLNTLHLSAFLKLWYSQPLFASLKKRPHLLRALFSSRMKQNPSQLSAFLNCFSAGKIIPPKLHPETLFLYGAEDLKYRSIYLKLPSFVEVKEIANSGHFLILENPKESANAIKNFLCHRVD